jgi:uncharacterized membrane protein YgaE (UPF0421/DUF939 family)
MEKKEVAKVTAIVSASMTIGGTLFGGIGVASAAIIGGIIGLFVVKTDEKNKNDE